MGRISHLKFPHNRIHRDWLKDRASVSDEFAVTKFQVRFSLNTMKEQLADRCAGKEFDRHYTNI
jgi:hypothetical protein